MTVEQLRRKLLDLPPTMLVVMSRDPEGNSFSELSDTCVDHYNTRTGELSEDTPFTANIRKVLVLWPDG